MKVDELKDKAVDAAKFLKSMSNESRLLILCHLAEGEKSVGELQSLVELSQSALSQHLAVLRRDGIVATRRSSQTIFYRLANEPAREIMQTLYAHFCGTGSKRRKKASRKS
ncbi:MAG: DNA-binding transcriptional ArsR family regulator [Gammaproteobacteria bacterium]|jgi:DNA-binding transcriptional ArsR family regulator